MPRALLPTSFAVCIHSLIVRCDEAQNRVSFVVFGKCVLLLLQSGLSVTRKVVPAAQGDDPRTLSREMATSFSSCLKASVAREVVVLNSDRMLAKWTGNHYYLHSSVGVVSTSRQS